MKRWKQILAPWAVFLLGVIFGAGATGLVVVHKARKLLRSPPEQLVARGTDLVARRLDLDPGQRAAVAPVFEELKRELATLRIESAPRVREIIEKAAAKLRPTLRPEQEEKLDAMLAAARARWDQREPVSDLSTQDGP